MGILQTRQFVLRSRPDGALKESDFQLETVEMPRPGEGEILVKSLYFTIEALMRGFLDGLGNFPPIVAPGQVMQGRAVGKVIESNNPDYPVGTLVNGLFGWKEHVVSNGSEISPLGKQAPVEKLPDDVPVPVSLSVLGGTGLTAYLGLFHIAKIKAGDTVVVSGAAGATGSAAAQIAKIEGCRVIGIAGGHEKCAWLTEELGLDAAINYREQNVDEQLKQLCPDGVNVYFDNVGGEILEAVLNNLAFHARIAICGAVSNYNQSGDDIGPKNLINLVLYGATMQGFSIRFMGEHFPEASRYLKAQYESGKLISRETIVEGFENLPKSLVDLYAGANTGKLLVKAAD